MTIRPLTPLLGALALLGCRQLLGIEGDVTEVAAGGDAAGAAAASDGGGGTSAAGGSPGSGGSTGGGGGVVLGPGEPCTASGQCMSMLCSDEGVCCDSQCSGVCMSCVAATNGGNAGMCLPAVVGTDPQSDCAGVEVCDAGAACARGVHLWSTGFDVPGDDEPLAVDVDASDRIVVAGSFNTALDLGAGALSYVGGSDMFVARFASDGTLVDATGYGSSANDHAFVAACGDELAVAGTAGGSINMGGGVIGGAGGLDMIVARYDDTGAHRWSAAYGGNALQRVDAVACNAAGDMFVAGITDQTFMIDSTTVTASGLSGFVTKLTQSGMTWQAAWTVTINGNVNTDAIDLDTDGGVWLSGTFGGPMLDVGGTMIAQPASTRGGFVSKISASGAVVDAQAFGNMEIDDNGPLVAVDRSAPAKLYLVGSLNGNAFISSWGSSIVNSVNGIDQFGYRFDVSGAMIQEDWFGLYVGANQSTPIGAAAAGSGDVAIAGEYRESLNVAGTTFPSSPSEDSGYVFVLDDAGNHVWHRAIGPGDLTPVSATDVAIDSGGNVIVVGEFSGTINLGGSADTLTAPSGADIFMAKMTP